MSIYIVETGEYRLANYIEGVFSTVDSAKAHAETLFKNSVDGNGWEITEGEDGVWHEYPDGTLEMTYDDTCYWRVTKHELQS